MAGRLRVTVGKEGHAGLWSQWVSTQARSETQWSLCVQRRKCALQIQVDAHLDEKARVATAHCVGNMWSNTQTWLHGHTAALKTELPWTIFTSMTESLAHISLPVSTPRSSRSVSPGSLASSSSSKQESSPNDGIKRVRKMTEKRERERMWQTAFCSPTPTDSQLWRKRKRKRKERDSKSRCSFSDQPLSVFSSSSSPEHLIRQVVLRVNGVARCLCGKKVWSQEARCSNLETSPTCSL